MTRSFEVRAVEANLEIPAPIDRDRCVEEFARMLMCPLVLDEGLAKSLNLVLIEFWMEHLHGYAVDDEASLVVDANDLWDLEQVVARIRYESSLGDDPRTWLINARTWYARAVNDFLDATRLVRAPLAQRVDYSKHLPRTGSTTDDDIQLDSALRQGKEISYFRHGVPFELFNELVRDAEDDLAVAGLLFGRQSLRAAVACMEHIGWVGGMPSYHLAVEWGTHMVHAYPISEAKVKRLTKDLPLCTSDVLQGAVRGER